MDQIVTTPNEANASIIKSVLEEHGIKASYSDDMNRNAIGSIFIMHSCTVYCEKGKKEEALRILKELKLISE